MSVLQLVAQSSDLVNDSGSGANIGVSIFLFILGALLSVGVLAVAVAAIVAAWRVFKKAGYAGWKALIPIYSSYIYLKIAGRPGWWLILMFIPLVNIIFALIAAIDFGRMFGKSTAFSVFLLWLLPGVGLLILGFGKATYQGAATSTSSLPTQPLPLQ